MREYEPDVASIYTFSTGDELEVSSAWPMTSRGQRTIEAEFGPTIGHHGCSPENVP